MPYTPTNYVDNSAPAIDAANLNKLETAASLMAYGPDGAANTVPVADGAGNITWQKVGNAQLATAPGTVPISTLQNYPADATKYLRGDGSWAGVAGASGQLDYATISASATVSASAEGTSVAVITGNSVTYDGSAVVLEFFLPSTIQGTNNMIVNYVVYQDSAVVGQVRSNAGVVFDTPIYFRVLDTPAAGTHIYKVAVFVSTSSVTLKAGPGGSGNLVNGTLRVVRA